MRMCDLGYKNPGLCVQYARIILMTKLASRTMYAVPRILSEVYFGLKSSEPSTKVLWETVSDLSDLSKLLILHVLPFKKFLLTQTLKVWLFDQKYSKTIIFCSIVAI